CCDPFILPATCPSNLLDTVAHPEYLKVLNRTIPDFCSNQTNSAAPPSSSLPAPGGSPAGSSPPPPAPASPPPPAPASPPPPAPASQPPPVPAPGAAGTTSPSPPPPPSPGKPAGSAVFFGPGSTLSVLVAGVLALLV
ncbi:unnamed protein product, partial [Closterium sp. NIES-53]